MKTEQYLIDQYNLFECKHLIKESQIENYFKDCGRDFFDDWTQGEYQDEVNIFVKIGDNFYDVYIEAEIGGQRMEYGENMYHIENIASVTWYETEKPIETKRNNTR